MSRALADLSECEEGVVDALAHMLVVEELSKHVPGYEGLFEYYEEHGLTPEQRRYWEAFKARVLEIRQDMANLLQHEGEG